jgi:hypothetical protein
MGAATNHHYVPQFYLRRWARAPGQKLWRYSRIEYNGKLDEQPVSPKSAGSKDNLYTLHHAMPFLNPAAPDIIETEFFGGIDNAAAVAMARLIDGAALTSEQKVAWSKFLSSLIHRSAHVLKEMDEMAPELARDTYDKLIRMGKTAESADRMRELLDSMDQVGVALNSARQHMIHEINDSRLVDYFQGCEWRVFGVNPDYPLITSDLPLLMNPGRVEKAPIEMMTCALSPERLFFLYNARNGDFDSEEDLKELAANLILVNNFEHAKSKAKHLYSHQKILDNERWQLRTFVESTFGIGPPHS